MHGQVIVVALQISSCICSVTSMFLERSCTSTTALVDFVPMQDQVLLAPTPAPGSVPAQAFKRKPRWPTASLASRRTMTGAILLERSCTPLAAPAYQTVSFQRAVDSEPSAVVVKLQAEAIKGGGLLMARRDQRRSCSDA